MTQELQEGDLAPDFHLPTWTQNEQQELSLSSFKGKLVVLYFYPRDDTPGCTVEACSFRDSLASIEETGATVIGISRDTLKSHQKFADKFSLQFPLLADTNADVAKAYGCWSEKSMYGKKYMGVDRATFLIDGEGYIRKIWRKVTPQDHAADVLKAILKLKS